MLRIIAIAGGIYLAGGLVLFAVLVWYSGRDESRPPLFDRMFASSVVGLAWPVAMAFVVAEWWTLWRMKRGENHAARTGGD